MTGVARIASFVTTPIGGERIVKGSVQIDQSLASLTCVLRIRF